MDRYALFWSWIRRIPRGRVATYGQIAALAGLEGHARQVGYALHNLPAGAEVPWHRVINAQGEISPRSAGDSHELQRLLLEAEGVELDVRGRIDLARYRWERAAKAERPRQQPRDGKSIAGKPPRV
ncbi:MAG TPA: MGMT family protein [Thermoanaerobaculia bacterium]|nr:MGMT family protein [Thermoanaerobaculia bacterium]